MNCPQCDGRLLVTETFTTEEFQTQGRKCENCGKRFTSVNILIGCADRRGRGPYAAMQRFLRRGTPRVVGKDGGKP
jgi:hypothetical protein